MGKNGPTIKLVILVLVWISIACSNERKANEDQFDTEMPHDSSERAIGRLEKNIDRAKDSVEILTLIRQMLIWSDTDHFDVHPYALRNDTVIGFDFDLLNRNLKTLGATGFFAEEFIENYVRILRNIDKRIRNNEIKAWLVYDGYPPIPFASDASPWCRCQDTPEWDGIFIEIISLDNEKGELKWKWAPWRDFSYLLRVIRIDSKWRVSYLEGFDYKDSTK